MYNLVHLYCYQVHNPCVPAYDTVTPRAIIPVVAWCWGLSTADWTGFWTRWGGGGQESKGRGWHGGAWAGAYRRIHFVNLFYFLSGDRQEPQEGRSNTPRVSIHLRRVGGVFLDRPASSQPHLIKEATSGFRIDRRGHDHLRGRMKRFILTNRFTDLIANPCPNGLPLNPHQEPQQQEGSPIRPPPSQDPIKGFKFIEA